MRFFGILTLALSLVVPLTSSAATHVEGTFALQGGVAKTAAQMSASAIGNDMLDRHFDIWMTLPDSHDALRAYDVDMTEPLHLIVVSDDFRTFLHIHPRLLAGGHFVIDQRLPRATDYHVYADAEPHGIGQQVFRFDLNLGGVAGRPDLRATDTSVNVGPYRVVISTATFTPGVATNIVVHISKSGRPAKDLHPYLGALAHAVFLDADDLTYMHVHPSALASGVGNGGMPMNMDMPVMNATATSSPDMEFQALLRGRGPYRLWLQFRGGAKVYAAPFVIEAR